MKILIIGATGTIGKELYHTFKTEYTDVYAAHRNSEHYPVDITDSKSIKNLFNKLPKLDVVINAAGTAAWKPLTELSEEDYYIGIRSKLMGQVNLVHIAKDHINDNGVILLTTGILADHYEPNTVALSLVNGAIHSFVYAASNEIEKGIRLNVVAPGAISGDFQEDKKFAGHFPITKKELIDIYRQALTTKLTGQIFKKY